MLVTMKNCPAVKNMNRLITFCAGLTLIVVSMQINAQSNRDGSSPQFLFPEFIKGEVVLKNGQKQYALMNYNTVSEKMTYMQGEKIYDMIDIDKIDTIKIWQSKFIPAGQVFHEVLVAGDIQLFVEHKGEIIPPGKPVGYGGTSQVASSTYLSSIGLSSGYYNLELPSDFEVKLSPVFWTIKDGSPVSFVTEKQFLKHFPEKAAELKKHIKQFRVKFDRIPDVMRLVEFMNGNR
jgi:hypothetical protein